VSGTDFRLKAYSFGDSLIFFETGFIYPRRARLGLAAGSSGAVSFS
jgi:hypothetical protein